MSSMLFSRNNIVVGETIEAQASREIETTPGLFRASPEDAFMFGGELTRYVLSTAPIGWYHKHVTIDVKTHMLFPGMIPAIPGWHTDGAPRAEPVYGQKQPSDLHLQQQLTAEGKNTKFHLLVTGDASLTEFITEPTELTVPEVPAAALYADLNDQLKQTTAAMQVVTGWTWVTFDWWSLHRAVMANKFEWRYLIRITESDHIQPNTELRKVLRQQQQVYLVSDSYGW